MGLFGNKKKDTPTESVGSEEEKMPEKEDTYGMTITCDNCRIDLDFDIPKGITVDDFLKNKKCEECGCNICQDEVDSEEAQ